MNLLLDTHVLLWTLVDDPARTEQLTLITRDEHTERYGVSTLLT